MADPIVFFDIAGENEVELKNFYRSCFGWGESDNGKLEVNATSPLSGAIRQDPPEKRIYVGVQSIENTLEKIEAFGGVVEKSRFEVTNVAVLGLFRDPAGNPMGLIELNGAEIKIP